MTPEGEVIPRSPGQAQWGLSPEQLWEETLPTPTPSRRGQRTHFSCSSSASCILHEPPGGILAETETKEGRVSLSTGCPFPLPSQMEMNQGIDSALV